MADDSEITPQALEVQFAYNADENLVQVQLSFGYMTTITFILPAEEAKRFGQQMVDYTLKAQADRPDGTEEITRWLNEI